MTVSPWLFWFMVLFSVVLVADYVIRWIARSGSGQPVTFGIERPDGTFEVLRASHYRVDRGGNLRLYKGLIQAALFKAGEWVYLERHLTEETVDQRGV